MNAHFFYTNKKDLQFCKYCNTSFFLNMLISDFFYLHSLSSSILLIFHFIQHRGKKFVYQLEYFESSTVVKCATVRKVTTLLFSFLKRMFSEDSINNVENYGFLYFHYKLFKEYIHSSSCASEMLACTSATMYH